MRARALMILLVSLVAVSVNAAYPVITSVAPERVSVYRAEAFMTIYLGPGFMGPYGATVVYDGPAGHFELQPSAGTFNHLTVWLPQEILRTPGLYAVSVITTNPHGRSDPARLEVYDDGRSLVLQMPTSLVAEATGPGGAVVRYDVAATSTTGSVTVTCTHASGAVYPLGTTIVTCAASDSTGHTQQGNLVITVRDTTPPSITVPADISVNASSSAGAVVTYRASATDSVDGTLPVRCTPPSGATFPNGPTTVHCDAVDANRNAASAVFHVTVVPNTPPPRLELPPDITAEATSPGGAAVTFTVNGYPGRDDHNGRPLSNVTCTPPSGSTFALGTTTVSCTAHDPESSTSSTGSFKVTVIDTTPPALTLPRSFAVRTTSDDGASASWSASAHDLVDGSVPITCTPPSGSTFPVGTTSVICTAADSRGNRSNGAFDVTVHREQEPVLEVPADITAEAEGPQGAVVTYTTSVFGDDENGRPVARVTCTPPSGSTFALGVTTVNCSATIDGGAVDGSFEVTVVDTTPPAFVFPAPIVTSNPVVVYSASAHDLVDGPVAIHCTPASGSAFPSGTTSVQCTASDSRGNASGGSFDVTVTQAGDTAPPVFTKITATPDVLHPANHKLVPVTIVVNVTDETDPAPMVRIYTVTANESIDAPGSGNTEFDWRTTGLLTLELRAERSGQGQDRVYRVFVEAIDASGNRSTASVDVRVPKDGNGESAPTQPTRRRASRP